MVSKSLIALLVVASVLVVNGHKILAEKEHKPLTSADVEALLDPVVTSLQQNSHKLAYTGPDGKEQCVTCQPFQGCGCNDVVGIRCELKRLRQKLHRMKAMAANPDAVHSHDE